MTFPRAPRSREHSQPVDTGCETPEPTEANLRGALGCMWACWPCVPGGAFCCPHTVRTVPRKSWLWLCTDTQNPLTTPQIFSQACGLTSAHGYPPSLPSLWSGLTHTGPAAALHPAFHSLLRLTSLEPLSVPGWSCPSSFTLTPACFRPLGALGTAPCTHTPTGQLRPPWALLTLENHPPWPWGHFAAPTDF